MPPSNVRSKDSIFYMSPLWQVVIMLAAIFMISLGLYIILEEERSDETSEAIAISVISAGGLFLILSIITAVIVFRLSE